MTDLSPSTKPTFRNQLILSVGVLLLLFPVSRTGFDLSTGILITSLICAGLCLCLHLQIRSFFKPPRWLRWILIPALVCGPPFCLISLPSPVSILVPLFALSWILGSKKIGPLPWWTRLIALFLFAWRGLSLSTHLPMFDFPHFPSATPVWIGIALVIPLGIATQERLRPFAKAFVLLMGCAAFLLASLIPLTLQFATGYKEIGEPARDFYSLDPLPGFRSVPEVGTDVFLPSELRKFDDPLLAVQVLNQMNLRLQPEFLEKLSGNEEKTRTVFLLQQGGFIQQDRYGFHVPASVYGTPKVPEFMDPSILELANKLAQHTSYTATKNTRPVLLRLRNLSLVDTVPNDSNRFRLTSQARLPFENGLYPRQVLFAASLQNRETPSRVRHANYAPNWNPSFDAIRQELGELVDLGILTIDPERSWYTPAYDQIVLPTADVAKGIALPILGLLILGTFYGCTKPQLISAGCFGFAITLCYATPFMPNPEDPLVIQAIWSTLWLPFSTILIGLASR